MHAKTTATSGTAQSDRPERPASQSFVGRSSEVAQLVAALDQASAGRGSLVTLTGEPGIGKTRLLDELALRAEPRGCDVLVGRCWEEGGAPAYWPWIQVVRAAGGEFERLSPLQPDGAASDPDSQRFRLFDSVTRFLAGRAVDRPQVVLLDDLHAADKPSLLLLRFLSESITSARVLVVASYRPTDRRVRELADVLAGLARTGRRLVVAGLGLDDVAAYMEAVVGRRPSAALVARLHHITGGNPFFVSEVVRLLPAAGTDAPDDRIDDVLPRLPEEVRTLVRRRIDGLSDDAVSVLRQAAVVGREFDVGILGRTNRLTIGRLRDVLDEAVAAGVVVRRGESTRRYAFVHELVRETLYGDMPARKRMELHLAIGRGLENMHRADLDPHLSEIARHFDQAAPLADPSEAAEYVVRAGDRAAAVLAYEEAALHYGRGLELIDDEDSASAERRCELMLRLGDAYWRAGDTLNARSTFEEAAALARRLGAAELLGRAALGYVTGLGGFLLFARFEVGGTATELLEEALGALPERDSRLRALLLGRLAVEMYSANHPVERRLSISGAAIEMARRLGDREALGTALHARQWALATPDLIAERLATTDEMLRVASESNDMELAFLAHNARLNCHLELGDGPALGAALTAMAELADRARQPFFLWHVICLRVVEAAVEGRLADAERLAREALEIARMRHSVYADYMFQFAQMVAIRWAQGRLVELEDALAPHAERFPWVPRWREALLATELPDPGAARAELERHGRYGFADLPRDGLWLLRLSALAEASVLVGDERRAEQLYELLLPFGDRFALSYTQQFLGSVGVRLAMLARLLRRLDEAERHASAALERCLALGARPASVRARAELATILRARHDSGDTARADALLAAARAECEELGLDVLLERLEPPSGAGVAAVFRREGDFWTIAYGGTLLRLRDIKGLRYIATLLASPGKEIHVLELVTAGTNHERRASDPGLPGGLPGGAGPALDARAKAAYRRRLEELASELQEARDWSDPERAARIELEIDALTGELASAIGLGGRDRETASPAERARVSVTKAIQTALRSIRRESPELADHLAGSIQTGRFCSYAPRATTLPGWTL
jgi:eukaryotic-like serine/threonine-protein kinase